MNEVVVTIGADGALFNAALALINPGDEVSLSFLTYFVTHTVPCRSTCPHVAFTIELNVLHLHTFYLLPSALD